MKIAVIGAGISGLGAALALNDRHDVRLFEADSRFGGHANTIDIEAADGTVIPVDTGFIVFNDRNYPNLCALFDHLDVPSENSDMSFSLTLDGGRLEYACDDLARVFAQRWRACDPRFLRAFAQIMRFHREAPGALDRGELDGVSLGDWLDREGYGPWIRKNFLYAMGGAIWSTPLSEIERFPARALIQFFHNHALLAGFEKRIQWRTVSGGSREYVTRLLQRLGPRAQAGVAATRVRRLSDGAVEVALADGAIGRFDEVVLAVHPDQALRLLDNAGDDERALLSAITYTDNTAVLHRDLSLMPRLRRVWSSWNVLSDTGAEARPAAVSYWMNRLQNIDPAHPLFVTLNPPHDPDPALEYARFSYAHPLFDQKAFDAQTAFDSVQGRGGVWYAGAWLGWGFHEDGLRSGLRAAEALGARPSWARELGAPLSRSIAIAAE